MESDRTNSIGSIRLGLKSVGPGRYRSGPDRGCPYLDSISHLCPQGTQEEVPEETQEEVSEETQEEVSEEDDQYDDNTQNASMDQGTQELLGDNVIQAIG